MTACFQLVMLSISPPQCPPPPILPPKGLKKERKDYTFRCQFNEKPSITPGCPGPQGLHVYACCCHPRYTATLAFSSQHPHTRLQVLRTAARPSLGSSTAQTPLGCPTPPLCTPLHPASVKVVSKLLQQFSRPAPQMGSTIQLDGHRIILSLSQSKLAQLEEGQSHRRPG